MLDLLVTTEAVLRVDFDKRVSGKMKDGLSRRFRKIAKERGKKIRLDQDILNP